MKESDFPHRSLILGGVKSGKSGYAERLAKTCAENESAELTLIATALAGDEEIRLRIERHKADRDKQWAVVEEPLLLARSLNAVDQQTRVSDRPKCIVVDCLTMWITNLLLEHDEDLLRREVNLFRQAALDCTSPLILVSNETNLGITPLGELSRRFCDETGLLHQALGQICDQVVLMVAGNAMYVKGQAHAII
ncbi:MAG: bifunctional adenosylcobinamide kinase/adenosylcobinamide-phosphate guanylyltransferase [Granulosicoccus sp.]